MLSTDVHDLEDYLIDTDLWEHEDVPTELLEKARALAKSGISAGIGNHPVEGWFGLATGQGPFVFWQEQKDL